MLVHVCLLLLLMLLLWRLCFVVVVVVLRPRFFVLWVDSLLSVWFSFVLAVLVLQFGFYFAGLGG